MEKNEEYYTTNIIASYIKGLAIIVAVGGIIASLVQGFSLNSFIVGFVGCIVSVLSVLILYAIGEGLQILDDIKRNSEHIRDGLEREEK